jgi:hypothetical protein
MEAIHSSQMLVTFYKFTWHHNPEDHDQQATRWQVKGQKSSTQVLTWLLWHVGVCHDIILLVQM